MILLDSTAQFKIIGMEALPSNASIVSLAAIVTRWSLIG